MSDYQKMHVDRRTLYEEVWSEPVSLVATRYGISDVGLAKICRSLTIPLPSRGYWAKVKAGRVMKRVPLPPAGEAHQETTKLVKLSDEQIQTRAEEREKLATIRKELPDVRLPGESLQPHPLVHEASKRLHGKTGWPKDTGLRGAPSEVLNISATHTALDRALEIANRLLTALAIHDFSVHLDCKNAVTVLRMNSTATELTFSLTEQVKRSAHEITEAEEAARKRYFDRIRKGISSEYPSIPQYDYSATGLLIISIGRWPCRTWRDTPKKKLEERLGEVVAGTLALAKETHFKKLEELRREQERKLVQENYERLVRRRELETVHFQEMETQALNWERAERIRSFIDAVEQRRGTENAPTQDEQGWLLWARAKADWLDPLIKVSDPILDAPEPKKPGYCW